MRHLFTISETPSLEKRNECTYGELCSAYASKSSKRGLKMISGISKRGCPIDMTDPSGKANLSNTSVTLAKACEGKPLLDNCCLFSEFSLLVDIRHNIAELFHYHLHRFIVLLSRLSMQEKGREAWNGPSGG